MLTHALESYGIKNHLEHIIHKMHLPEDTYDKFDKTIVQDVDHKLHHLVNEAKQNAKEVKKNLKKDLAEGKYGFVLKMQEDEEEAQIEQPKKEEQPLKEEQPKIDEDAYKPAEMKINMTKGLRPDAY